MSKRWRTKPLGELCRLINGRAFKPSDWGQTGLPIIRIQNLNDARKPFNFYGGQVSGNHLITSGAILLSWSGTPGTSFGCFRWNRGNGVLNQHIFKVLVDDAQIDGDFFISAVNSRLEEMIEKAHGGVGLRHITKSKLEAIHLPIPPLDEQRRIVAQINECMERIQEIDVHSQSLVDEYKSLKFSTVSHETAELTARYVQKTLGELVAADHGAMRSGPFGSAMRHDEFVKDGHLVIGIANVQQNRFEPVRKWMISDAKYEQMKRYAVAPGDVLITIMGTIGRTCVVPNNIGQAITSKHVYRVRLPEKANPHYVSYLINYDDDARTQLFGTATGGVMPGLNATKLRNLRFALPPRTKQDEVVARLDRAHRILMEREGIQAQSSLALLRDAILRKAFAGEL